MQHRCDMDLNAWLTLLAVFISPIVAVLISIWVESRRRKRDGRLLILRQLMATRHLPSDPLYSQAVNLVPIEFNDEPRVMAAYKAYQEAVQQEPGEDAKAIARSSQNTVVKQTKMIFAMMQALKLKASEADLPVEAYAAQGMINRDALWLNSLHGTIRIANALEAQVRMLDDPGSEPPALETDRT